MTINAKMRKAMEENLSEDINSLNRSIREIMECRSIGIVSTETALAMRDHIDDKIDALMERYDALKKADRICYVSPVTGPMARKSHGPMEELTDKEKELIMDVVKKYYGLCVFLYRSPDFQIL